MTDLYDEAAAVPGILRGSRANARYDAARRAAATPARLRWALAKGRVSHPFRDAYVLGSGEPDLLDLIRAAMLILPRSAVVSHHTATTLYGFGVVDTDSIHVTVPAGAAVPQRRGIVAHESALRTDAVVNVFGVPCLPPARCAVDLARRLPCPDALAVLDAALHAGASTLDDLAAEADRHARLRGVRQARDLVRLATPLADCRQESHLRLVLHDGRLPVPRPQLVVVDEWGVERCRIDLAYDEERVGVEYDGTSHLSRGRLRTDRRRHNWLAERGWRMRYFTDFDLYRQPVVVVDTVRAALSGRRSRTFAWIKA
jgi:very-short-patch-repair endonuclease